jgi:ribosome-binding factor A
LIYGGVALWHAVRVSRDAHYANFFVRPAPASEGGMRVGVSWEQ